MSTYDTLFGNLPKPLRDELHHKYDDIINRYNEEQWGPSELDGGKFCEVVYTILDGYVKGVYPAKATKPRNMEKACQQLANSSAPDSVRLSIPRVLIALYDFRNRRGVGHVGGEVDANHMDAEFVLGSARWILSELVRVYNGVTTKDAQSVVDELSQRITPLVWTIDDVKRVLVRGLSKRDETLILLYSATGMSMTEKDLANSLEHSNTSVYRRDILIPNHKTRLWEYNRGSGVITLSPEGVRRARILVKEYSDK